MKNKKVGRKVRNIIILISLINILVMVFLFIVRLRPIIPILENNKNAINDYLKNNEYDNLNELTSDIDILSKKYNLTYSIKDSNDKLIKGIEQETLDIILFDKMIIINDESYIISFYPNFHISISRLLLELFIFEVVFVSIIFFIIFLFARKQIIKPVDKIVSDIKNYKHGKKPVKVKLNDEFDLIQNEFIKLTNELEEEKQEQNRIISSISHDLKTPLTSIMGYSDLIDDDNTTKEEMKEYNKKIISKSKHLKNLLNSFDDYLISNSNTKLKTSEISINEIIKYMKDDYEVELKNNNIDFIVESNVKKVYLNIDYTKIKRVFSNIISNSVRYLKNGGVIKVKIEEENNYIKFIISDNGPGVDEKIIDKIFDPLFTTDSSRKISGLGLSICKEFIELHEGTIKGYNNNGFTVEFTLPKIKEEKC